MPKDVDELMELREAYEAVKRDLWATAGKLADLQARERRLTEACSRIATMLLEQVKVLEQRGHDAHMRRAAFETVRTLAQGLSRAALGEETARPSEFNEGWNAAIKAMEAGEDLDYR